MPGSKTHGGGAADRPDHYKWVVLTNTTLGVLMATIDISIMLIALPDIFRGGKYHYHEEAEPEAQASDARAA